jgi:hypothetical protein
LLCGEAKLTFVSCICIFITEVHVWRHLQLPNFTGHRLVVTLTTPSHTSSNNMQILTAL